MPGKMVSLLLSRAIRFSRNSSFTLRVFRRASENSLLLSSSPKGWGRREDISFAPFAGPCCSPYTQQACPATSRDRYGRPQCLPALPVAAWAALRCKKRLTVPCAQHPIVGRAVRYESLDRWARPRPHEKPPVGLNQTRGVISRHPSAPSLQNGARRIPPAWRG